MKNLMILFAAISAGTAPLLSQLGPKATETVQLASMDAELSGQEAVGSIRSAYEKGEYAQFLDELNGSYATLEKNGQLKGLADMRSERLPEWQDWEKRALKLQQEKSRALLDAVEGQPMTPFVQKVRSAAKQLSDDTQQKAIDRIVKFRFMAPGTGANEDENRMVDLDLEYEYKSLHLDLPGATASERREKQCALKMEKLDKMVAAAAGFKDDSLKQAVAVYRENFDERLAQSWDIADLNALATGAKKPADATEEKVASLLALYQEKFSELTQQFMSDHEKS